MKNQILAFVVVGALLSSCNAVSLGGILPDVPNLPAGTGDLEWQSLFVALLPIIRSHNTVPTISIRTHHLIGSAGYEALVAYSPIPSGLYLGKSMKQPKEKHTLLNKQKAVYHAIYTAVTTLYATTNPIEIAAIKTGVAALNIMDISYTATDLSKPEGVGNSIGQKLAAYFLQDTFNQLGNRTAPYNSFPFSDYTGYKPVNSVDCNVDIRKWQPLLVQRGIEIVAQTYQQILAGEPITYKSPREYLIAPPTATFRPHSAEWKQQNDLILAYSAVLNDSLKVQAELGAQVIAVVNTEIFHMIVKNKWGFEDTIRFFFAKWFGLQETMVTYMYLKTFFDSARPTTAIRASPRYTRIRAYGGPGKGTVEMDAKNFVAYVPVVAEPEYPSGAAAAMVSSAVTSRRYTGSEDLSWSPIILAKSSKIEVGLTPMQDMQLNFPTHQSLVNYIKEARIIGGVHYRVAVDAGEALALRLAKNTYDYIEGLFAGNQPGLLAP